MKLIRPILLGLAVTWGNIAHGEDWPTWRHDPGRTGATPEVLPAKLNLQWTLKLPPLVPAYKDQRLQFDKGYEPIVTRGKLIVGSSWTDSVTAYDATTGEQAWIRTQANCFGNFGQYPRPEKFWGMAA